MCTYARAVADGCDDALRGWSLGLLSSASMTVSIVTPFYSGRLGVENFVVQFVGVVLYDCESSSWMLSMGPKGLVSREVL